MLNKTDFKHRRDQLRSSLEAKALHGLLITHPPNRFYLSGFELRDPQPGESAGCLFIDAQDEDWLLTDARYLEAARRLWPEERIFIYSSKTVAAIKNFLLSQGKQHIGIEANAMTVSMFESLTAANDSSISLNLVSTNGLTEALRLCKDPSELEFLRASCRLNHELMNKIPDWLSHDLTEKDMAWEIEKFFRQHGAEELAFSTIVAAGRNASLPHAIPGLEQLPLNGPVLIDAGCRLHNYCSDQTRTFWLGNLPTSDFKSAMARVREAQEHALGHIKPGLPIAEAYQAAQKTFARYGVESYFTHSLGHGIGLETHEAPSLGPNNQNTFLPGMVITVEPGLYYPHWGGIRWEYMVLVTDDGMEIL